MRRRLIESKVVEALTARLANEAAGAPARSGGTAEAVGVVDEGGGNDGPPAEQEGADDEGASDAGASEDGGAPPVFDDLGAPPPRPTRAQLAAQAEARRIDEEAKARARAYELRNRKPNYAPVLPPPEAGAVGSVRQMGVQLLDVLNLLCAPGEPGRDADDGGGCLPSEEEKVAVEARAALVSAGAVGACGEMLAASLRGGRSTAERRLRCELLGALGALAQAADSPKALRLSGVPRLLQVVLGGPSTAEFSACSRLWAGADEGKGGVYPREAARVMTRGRAAARASPTTRCSSCIRHPVRRCYANDAAAADEAWADEPLGATLCACVDTVGMAAVPSLRSGSTRAMLVAREERFSAQGGSSGGGGLAGPHAGSGKGRLALTGWPADTGAQLQLRALELLSELTKHMPSEHIRSPPPSRAATLPRVTLSRPRRRRSSSGRAQALRGEWQRQRRRRRLLAALPLGLKGRRVR